MSEETELSEEAFKEVIYYLKFGLKKNFEDALYPVTKILHQIYSEVNDLRLTIDMSLQEERESNY